MKSFYGGKDGIDIVCFGPGKHGMQVMASGSKTKMLKLARKHNWAVAEVRAIRFRQPTREQKEFVAEARR